MKYSVRTTSMGWGIEITPINPEKAPYLVGRYYIEMAGYLGSGIAHPPQYGGYRTAVFDTRREAEVVAKGSRRYTTRGECKDCALYARVRVVRVRVTVQVERA